MRVFDASAHNRIANHPDVRPSFGWFDGEVSFDAEVADTDNYVFLLDGDCAAIFEWSAPGVFQVHTMSLPGSRGKGVIEAGRRMVGWMREHMSARMIWGLTPRDNRAARSFNRLMGAKVVGERTHPVTGLCDLFVLEAG
jgi:hypothetical protein